MALYLHLGPFARQVIIEIERLIDKIDRGDWHAPERVAARAPNDRLPVAVPAE
jgi:hypothetical protein